MRSRVSEFPRISFGIIVLNGEPFTRYCLRSIYPFAYEIIAVEGAVPAAAGVATPEGHSTDGTLEILRRFKEEEDGEHKLQIIARDGFWCEKDEMSRAYAERATGDYLWQVDVDEFYKIDDMRRVVEMLRADPTISAVSFEQLFFWGGFNYCADGWYLRLGGSRFHRLFRWGRGYTYKTHRPPTVLDPNGVDTRAQHHVSSDDTMRQGMFLYHYSHVFPKQVTEKSEYYGNAEWARRNKAQIWAEEVFGALTRPFRVHNVYDFPSWLERFAGDHPAQIRAMLDDIAAGRLRADLRSTEDVERILESRFYRAGRRLLRIVGPRRPAQSRTGYRWQFRLYRLLGAPLTVLRALPRKIMRFP